MSSPFQFSIHFLPAGRQSRRRGAVLLMALLVSTVLATTLTSLIALVINSTKLADRSYYQNAAVNLAEMGIEEAIYCFNKLADVPATPANAWTPYGWTIAADNSASRTLPTIAIGAGVTADVRIYCSRYNPTSPLDQPVVVARSTITFPSGPSMSKILEITLRKRSLFPRGMVVRETIDADGGNLSLDSWDSGDDEDPTTPIIAYSTATRRANATIATLSTADNAISIGNGKVYGYISTANRSDGTSPIVAHQPEAALNGDFIEDYYDAQRVSHDFDVATFPTPTVPTGSIEYTITDNVGARALPRAGDAAAADGYYYYSIAAGRMVALNSGSLDITAKVVIKLQSHTGVDAMVIGGSSGMTIAAGGALKVYTNGNVSITGGGGLSNANDHPSTCVFFGTDTSVSGQTINLRGNGLMSVALYAPNARITMSGGGSGGDFFGALVGKSVRMTGTARFHYDEALARMYTGKPFSVAKWRELHTAAERNLYAAKF